MGVQMNNNNHRVQLNCRCEVYLDRAPFPRYDRYEVGGHLMAFTGGTLAIGFDWWYLVESITSAKDRELDRLERV